MMRAGAGPTEVNAMSRQSLDEQLSALEAALPFLRQSLADADLDARIAQYSRDILGGAQTPDERDYVHGRLDAMFPQDHAAH